MHHTLEHTHEKRSPGGRAQFQRELATTHPELLAKRGMLLSGKKPVSPDTALALHIRTSLLSDQPTQRPQLMLQDGADETYVAYVLSEKHL